MKTDAFSAFHPLVNLSFFASVIGLSMFLMHPVFLTVSVLCAGGYLIYLLGSKGFFRQVGYLLPVLLFTAMLNPLFNHRGATTLFALPNGNPVTLESLCFGLASAVMMGATILWFNCCNAVFTTDKIIYLFGRIIPSLSLLISMTLRFIPRFKEYLQQTLRVLRAMRPPKTKIETLKQALTAFSATVSWAMEQSIVTADSMKSRGYGAAGRTAYANYRFEKRDAAALAAVARKASWHRSDPVVRLLRRTLPVASECRSTGGQKVEKGSFRNCVGAILRKTSSFLPCIIFDYMLRFSAQGGILYV